jgi:hypothetical protein
MIARFALAVLLGVASGGAGSAEIKTYDTRLAVAPDGSGLARVDVQLTGAQAGRLRLPVGFAVLDGFQAVVPTGVTVKPVPAKDQSAVDIELPENVAADLKLGFTFKVPGVLFEPKPEEGQKPTFPEGTRLLRHAFVNTQPTPIAQYRMQVLLPPQTMVEKIREQLPRPRRKEFVPRVELDRVEGLQGALLQFSGLRQGDRTSMELEVVGERRSWLWIAVGLVLAGAWLAAYRFIVRPEQG